MTPAPPARNLALRLDPTALQDLRRLAGGDNPAMLITFLDQFLGTTPVTLRALAQAASVPAREPLRRLAHNLGGTSAYVGAGILHSQAHTLEEAAETEGPGALGARVNELVTEFEAVRPLLVAAREEALQETLAA